MKNLLTIIILLCFINAGAQQSIVYTPMTAAGYQYKYVKTDSGFNLPNIDTTTGRGTVRGGSMVFNPANRTFYGWDGIRWSVLGSGSSSTSGTFVDSITVSGNNVCQWIAGVPTCYTVIANSIFYGVDSLTYSGNSICWWKNGVPSCYSIVGSGVDSVTVINGLFCEWKNGVASCDSIFNNVLNVFIDSITIINNQLCQYVGGVPTCYTINNTSTGVDSITVVDSILCSWSQGVSTCFNLNRTDTIYVKDDLTVDTTTNPGHQTIGRLHDDGLITPGYVTWSGTGLTFDVTSADYYLNRTHYISPQSQITLDPADPTDPRLDVVGVDTTTAVIKITGTAAAVPITPQIDPSSEIALTTILLNAGDTIPTGIGLKVIYNENTEWTTAHTGTMTVNFNNTDNPYIGTKSAFVSSYNNRSALTFTDSGLDTVNLMNVLKMFIWLNCPLTNQFQFQFFLNTTAVSNRISFGNSFGLNSAVVNSWQNVSIPYSAFTWTGQTFNKLVITMAGTDNSCGYYIDYIQIQSGLNLPGKSFVDSVSVIAGSDYYWKNGIKTLIGVRTSGTGTVTSISQGYGIINTPNPITTTGTIAADTVALSAKYVRITDTLAMLSHYLRSIDTTNKWVNDVTYLNDSTITIWKGSGSATVRTGPGSGGGGGSGITSISQGNGIIAVPNPITTTGTIKADTSTAITGLTTLYKNGLNYSSASIYHDTLLVLMRPNGTSDTVSMSIGMTADWRLIGNSGTVTGTNFVGTTDNVPLMFKVNNLMSGYLDSVSLGAGRTYLGLKAGLNNSDQSLTAIGYEAAKNTTTGNGNTAGGNRALFTNILGNGNTAIGDSALLLSTTTGNTALGYRAAGALTTGGSATAIGHLAMSAHTGNLNTAVGYEALKTGSGASNVAVGRQALGIGTVSGSNNIAMGYQSLANVSSGAANIGVGYSAGLGSTTQSNQLFINSLARANYVADQNQSIIYGQQHATNISSQYLTVNGKIGQNILTPTAWLHLSKGTVAAGEAPMKFAAPVTLTTTAASGNGTVATLTFATTTNPVFAVGSTVIVSGVTPAGYNGTFPVSSVTATTISYTNATTGAQTVAGTIKQGDALLTTPEAGAVEYDGTNAYLTNSTAARYYLTKTLTNTATLDFASTAAGAVSDLTITVTGAAVGDAVTIGVPNGSVTATATFWGWVSSANTVTIRFSPKATEDPASGTFRATVEKY